MTQYLFNVADVAFTRFHGSYHEHRYQLLFVYGIAIVRIDSALAK